MKNQVFMNIGFIDYHTRNDLNYLVDIQGIKILS